MENDSYHCFTDGRGPHEKQMCGYFTQICSHNFVVYISVTQKEVLKETLVLSIVDKTSTRLILVTNCRGPFEFRGLWWSQSSQQVCVCAVFSLCLWFIMQRMHLFHIQTICTYFLFNLSKTLVCLYVQNVNTTCVLAFSHMLVRSCNLQSVGLILCASALDGLHVWSASPGAAFLSDSRRATTSLNSLWIAAFSLRSAELLGLSELRWSGSASLWPETDLSREMLTNKDRTWELRAVLLHGIGFFLKTLLSSGGVFIT